jgi:hypothetical protein
LPVGREKAQEAQKKVSETKIAASVVNASLKAGLTARAWLRFMEPRSSR